MKNLNREREIQRKKTINCVGTIRKVKGEIGTVAAVGVLSCGQISNSVLK